MIEESTLSNQQFEKCTKLLGRILFPDDCSFSKVLWRMSSGSRSKAIIIARSTLKHYNFPNEMSNQDFEEIFDQACANVNGGLEVEWNAE